MGKQILRRILLVLLILTLASNIIGGYLFIKLTDQSTYSILGKEEFYEDISQAIYEETSNDFSIRIQARLQDENNIEVSTDFVDGVIKIVNETLKESNLSNIIATAIPENIDNFLGYIKGSKDSINFFIPKDKLIEFLDQSYPTLIDNVIDLIVTSEVCNTDGECLTEAQKDDLREFIEKDLDTQVSTFLEEIKNNEPLFAGDNQVSIDELGEILVNEANAEVDLQNIEQVFEAIRFAYKIGIVSIAVFAIFNIILFIGILMLGPITPLRISRNVGLVSFVSGILILVPFGTTLLGVRSIVIDWGGSGSDVLERAIEDYGIELISNLFEAIAIIGLLMTIIGGILLFVIPEILIKENKEVVKDKVKEEPEVEKKTNQNND